MAGNWPGAHTCAQGLPDLRLAIKSSANSINPDVPLGRYWMSGTYHPRSGKIVLRPSRWIKRPPNYLMVGLTGDVADGNASISGTVLNSSCSTFSVSRT